MIWEIKQMMENLNNMIVGNYNTDQRRNGADAWKKSLKLSCSEVQMFQHTDHRYFGHDDSLMLDGQSSAIYTSTIASIIVLRLWKMCNSSIQVEVMEKEKNSY